MIGQQEYDLRDIEATVKQLDPLERLFARRDVYESMYGRKCSVLLSPCIPRDIHQKYIDMSQMITELC